MNAFVMGLSIMDVPPLFNYRNHLLEKEAIIYK